jgi:hypothetical protein
MPKKQHSGEQIKQYEAGDKTACFDSLGLVL